MFDLKNLLNGSKSEMTVERYIDYWNLYVKFCGSEEEALKSENFAAWRQHMVNVDEYAANTINVRMNSVRSVVSTLAEHKLVSRETKWDFAETKGVSKKALRHRRRPNNRVKITAKQMRKMIGSPKPDLYEPLFAMHRALLLVLGTTGMRVGEVVNLCQEDIYLSESRPPHLRVTGKGQRERVIYLSATATQLLSEYLVSHFAQTEKKVFLNRRGKPISITGIQLQLAKYCRQADIWVTCHQLRHTFACRMIAAGVPVTSIQKMLGHSSIRTTQLYVRIADKQVEQDYHAGIQKLVENCEIVTEVPHG